MDTSQGRSEKWTSVRALGRYIKSGWEPGSGQETHFGQIEVQSETLSKQRRHTGRLIYEAASGGEVELTEVSGSTKPPMNTDTFDDVVYRGE